MIKSGFLVSVRQLYKTIPPEVDFLGLHFIISTRNIYGE